MVKIPLPRLYRLQPNLVSQTIGIRGQIFAGMLNLNIFSTGKRKNRQSHTKIPNTTLPPTPFPGIPFEWAGNEPRTPVFAYGSLIRVHIFLQSNQRRFSPFLMEGTMITAKPRRDPKGTEIPLCLKLSLLTHTRLII